MQPILNRQIIEETYQRIQPFTNRTPVMQSRQLNKQLNAEVYFKCENFQRVGAFKMRGAANAVLSLPEVERMKGVATHSSGNHAQALALAAREAGIPAHIVMPETAPKVKVNAVKDYGAQIYFCEPTLAAREAKLTEIVEVTGATFIHPYNNELVIAGQATAAMELIKELEQPLDIIITPVGGGGLLSGSILATQHFSPQTQVWAGEPEGADDAYQSWKASKLIPQTAPNTIADGLLTSVGNINWQIIAAGVEKIITVSDEEIIAAMRFLWERMKLVVEPSGAVPLAAIQKAGKAVNGKRIGIILSGGNVDLSKLPF